MELTDDAKKLIEDHCKSILEQNRATLREGEVEIQKWKDTLREADIYVWAARAFFFIVVLALGGSIYGIFKTQDYLDERIAKNTSNLERLFYAKSLSDSGQTPDALPEMLEFARYVSSSPQLENLADNTRNLFGNFAKAGPSIRSYFFINLLDVVSSIPTTNPEDTSFGRTEWEQLLKNTTFRTEILANPRWANDQRVLNNLGLATAKFAEDRSGVLKSKPYSSEEQALFCKTRKIRADKQLQIIGGVLLSHIQFGRRRYKVGWYAAFKSKPVQSEVGPDYERVFRESRPILLGQAFCFT